MYLACKLARSAEPATPTWALYGTTQTGAATSSLFGNIGGGSESWPTLVAWCCFGGVHSSPAPIAFVMAQMTSSAATLRSEAGMHQGQRQISGTALLGQGGKHAWHEGAGRQPWQPQKEKEEGRPHLCPKSEGWPISSE